jgi:hypothetical protein
LSRWFIKGPGISRAAFGRSWNQAVDSAFDSFSVVLPQTYCFQLPISFEKAIKESTGRNSNVRLIDCINLERRVFSVVANIETQSFAVCLLASSTGLANNIAAQHFRSGNQAAIWQTPCK